MSTETFTCRRITCLEAWAAENWSEIVQEYCQEIQFPDLKGDPDLDLYERSEFFGSFKAVGVMEGRRLLGFATYFITPEPHFRGQIIAMSDCLWVEPARRKTGLGLILIQGAERFAKEDGCTGFLWGCRAGTRAERVFQAIGTPVLTSFWRKL